MKYFIMLLFMFCTGLVFAQGITGPASVPVNSNQNYSFFDDYMLTNPYWDVTGGSIQSYSQSGNTYNCTVNWTNEGWQTLSFYDGASLLSQVSVFVEACTAATPSTAFSYTSSTTQVTITRSAAPPYGISWFWQTTPGATNTTNQSSSYTVTTAGGTYYLRAKNNNGDCWSVSELATGTIPTQPTGITGATRCGTGTVTLTATAPANHTLRWYANASGGSPLATNTTYTTPSISATTTYYVCSYRTATGAEGFRYPVTATVNPSSVGGTIVTSNENVINFSGALTISGQTGSVTKWEINTGSGWSTVAANVSTINFFNPTYTTAQYRAEVQNAACPTALSASLKVEKKYLGYGAGISLSANTGASYAWYLNGNIISGATAQNYTATQTGFYKVLSGSAVNAIFYVSSLASSQADLVNSINTVRYLKPGVTANSFVFQPHEIAQAVSFMDGLGRTFQTVAVGQSPTQKDIVAPVGHGRQGLVDTTYLPYISTASDGLYRVNALKGTNNLYTASEQYLFYQGTAKVATSTNPYARSIYRNTPDAAVLEQRAPGAAWQNSTRSTRSTVAWNNTTTYKVRNWKPDGTTTGDYPANSVAVAIITDENGNQVRTYTNTLGLTVLKQVEVASGTWLETYYIHDEFGRLKYEVPPKAVALLGSGTDVKIATLAELIYTYTYDDLGRLVEKKVPGAAVQFVVYDQHDRVVLTQDGNLRQTNQWLFVKYDLYGRVAYSGLYTNSTQTTRALVQGLANSNPTPRYETEQVNATFHGYTNLAWPTTNLTLLSVNYYDHYDFDRNGTADYTLITNHLAGQETVATTNTRGMSTGSKRIIFNENGTVPASPTWLINTVFYGQYDRPIQTRANNHLYTTVADIGTIVYDFSGKVIKSRTSHYQNASTVVHLEDRNEYDHAGRVLKTFRKINTAAEQLVAQYEYNALGQLVDKKLHNTGGSNFLQSVDYRYNIRGWLTSINNAQLNVNSANNDETSDYFGLELAYEQTVGGLTVTGDAQFNGNISAVQWKGLFSGASLEGINGTRGYKYAYDKSDRLLSATFIAQNTTGTYNKQNNTLNETLTYDANGNLLTLMRAQNNRGFATAGGLNITSTAQTIDQLTYTYANHSTGSQNTNRLGKVEDAITGATGQTGFKNGQNTTDEYTYNTDGSVLTDKNKGIDSVHYNVLGKPRRIRFSTGKVITYTYDAAGTRLRMRTLQGTTVQTTTNYSGSFVYEGTSPLLSFFGSPEGRVVKNGSNFEFQYNISDHQGNTRVVFSSVTPTTQTVTATYETAAQTTEATQFNNYPGGAGINSVSTNNNTQGGTHSQYLNAGYMGMVGVAKSYKVYAGDKVKIEAHARYNEPSGTNSSVVNFAAVLLTAFGLTPPAGGEMGTAAAAVNNWGTVAAGGYGNGTPANSLPKAFVNIILFDANYKLLDFSYAQVTSSGAPTLIQSEYIVKEAGYAYLFISNEHPTQCDVYFDDVKMSFTPGNVVQYNEYYPFGMQTANSWTRENVTGNNFLANGGTELNTTSNLYDLDFRNYDPALGRMYGVDPMASKYSSLTPYNYSYNNPVMFNDVNGADPYTINYSATNSPYYTMYTYDDRIDPTNLSEAICGMCWRNAEQMGFLGAATGYGGSMAFGSNSWQMSAFGSTFNNWVDGRIHASNILKGIGAGLVSEFGGNVNVQNGAFTPFLNDTQVRNVGARYVNDTNGWGYINGGKAGYLERIRPEGTVLRGSIFVDETIAGAYDEAKSYLKGSRRASKVISFLEANAVGMEIVDIQGPARYYYTDNILVWASKTGLELSSGFNSPSMLLMHELFHAFNDISGISLYPSWNVGRWKDSLEKFATKETNGVARSLGQGIRTSYVKEGSSFYMGSVNNFIPLRQSRSIANEKNLYNTRLRTEYQQSRYNIYWSY
ncbi:MAG: hypothetical protein J0L67_02820 [Cytophagales bacterium]|nr:hypothetical protein [Cytophagales bacterium]